MTEARGWFAIEDHYAPNRPPARLDRLPVVLFQKGRRRRRGGRRVLSRRRGWMAVDASVVAVVREFGRLDVVLESAKIRHRLKFFLDVSAEISDRIIAATLTGLFHLGQEATRKMVRQGGGVIVTLQFAVAVVLTNLQDRDCIEALTPGK